MKRIMTVLAVLGLLLAGVVATAASSSAGTPNRPAGGDYGLCIYPDNGAYAGAYVEGYGLVDHERTVVVGHGRVIAAKACVRKGTAHYIIRVRIDKILLYSPVSGSTHVAGPYAGGLKVGGNTTQAKPTCGQYVQTRLRYSVRYDDGALSGGTLHSGGFRRC